MKKNQAKILAQAIYDLVAKAETAEPAIASFIAYLQRRRWNYLLPEILTELEILHNQANNTLAVKIESANEISSSLNHDITEQLTRKLGQKIKTKNSINQDLLGGLLISYRDKIIDLSLRRQIINLKKQLIN